MVSGRPQLRALLPPSVVSYSVFVVIILPSAAVGRRYLHKRPAPHKVKKK